METIKNYLDNMFVNLPNSPEVLRAKEDLLEMMEDKYNELIAEGKKENEAIGIVISEFGNIQELAEELGIGNVIQEPDQDIEKDTDDNGTMRFVSDEEAEDYLYTVKQSSIKIAAGVMLCIYSPILLILLSGIGEYIVPIPEGIAAGIGVTVLLILVACAVGLFIYTAMKLEAYEPLKKECFYINNDFGQSVYNLQQERKGVFTFKIVMGVILCILSVVPVIITGCISEMTKNEFPCILAVVFLLVIVGIAVAMFITAGMEEESYHVILQEKEFAVKRKEKSKAEEILASIYWPVVVIIYLAWSFISGEWWITWIIWPLSAVLFAAISELLFGNSRKK